jgi:hypothetical protein
MNIENKILFEINSFNSKFRFEKRPTEIYIGHDDFDELRSNNNLFHIQFEGLNSIKFNGMDLYVVNRAHHLRVC